MELRDKNSDRNLLLRLVLVVLGRGWLWGGNASKRGAFADMLRTITIAVLLAVIFRSLLFEPFSIPSGSMIPTLKIGDYLFVSKFKYGYSRYSFPFAFIPFRGRIWEGEPERGDVIVFRKPGDESIDYIKRLVGLPGDEVFVRDGILHLNGKAVKREEQGQAPSNTGLLIRNATLYSETFPEGHTHAIQEFTDQGSMDNTPPRLVPAGHYFFLGDNRDNSRDSRAEIGFVPKENLVGRAEFIFFSHNGEGSFFKIWTWHRSIRFSRLGNSID